MALALDRMFPAVAVNVAEVELTATVTELGTVTSELLEDNVTLAPPEGAAPGSVTVQEVLARDVRLLAVHERCMGASSAMVAVAVVPLREAVTVALPLAVTVPEVAVKEAVV